MVLLRICLNGRYCSSGYVGTESIWQRWRQWVSASSSFSKRWCWSNFSEIFKGRQIVVEPCRNSKYSILSDVCYDDTKHYQVQSEHSRIHNLFKYLRWSIFAKTVNGLLSLTDYTKAFHFRCLKDFWIRLCWKAR